MPSFIIYGIPPVDRPDNVLALKRAVQDAAFTIEHIGVKKGRFPVFCPCDRDTISTGEAIVVSIEGLFDRISRSREVRNALCERALAVVQTWAATNVPQCDYIEIQLDHPYNKGMGHAEWKREPRNSEGTPTP